MLDVNVLISAGLATLPTVAVVAIAWGGMRAQLAQLGKQLSKMDEWARIANDKVIAQECGLKDAVKDIAEIRVAIERLERAGVTARL